MTSSYPFVSVIIANYNGEKYLSDCLSSVTKTKYSNYEIIVVDDGSTDTSEKIIKQFQKKDGRILYTKNEKNLGAAASRNKAIKKAKGAIVVFLDNDTQVDRNWLLEIVKTLAVKDIGGCQALLMDFENRNRIQVAGTKLWAQTGWGLPIDTKQLSKKKSGEIPIVALSAALAIKREVLEKVEGFDEDAAVVTEDLDFSWRIWIAGYKIVLCSNAVVYHWTKSVSMRKHMSHTAEKIYFHLTKNSLMSITKNYELSNVLKYIFNSTVITLSRASLVLIRRADASACKGSLHGFLWFLMNLSDILKKRKKVQRTRVFTDAELFDTILIRGSALFIYNHYYKQTNLL